MNENKQGSNIKYLPFVFTEQGVAMLSSILKTENAAKVSIAIMDAFVAMRHFISDNQDIYVSLNNINNKLIEHDNKINALFKKFDKNELKEKVFYESEFYDAYSKIVDLMKQAENELIIVDSYADKTVLDMISNIKTKTTIITKKNYLLKKLDIEKYQKQYTNLEIVYSNLFHDRFIFIDEDIIYHLGTSLNHMGSKIFVINKLEDKDIKKALLSKIEKIIKKDST